MAIRSQTPTLCRGRFRDYPEREYRAHKILCATGSASPERINFYMFGDDIVRALWKHRDKRKEMVVGSNPTTGAKNKIASKAILFYGAISLY